MAADQTIVFEGPIPIAAGNLPFRGAGSPLGLSETSTPDLLARFGYVEEEFFVSGAVLGLPYRTSILVRRPVDLARFSGLAALETVHIQGALGLWQTSHQAIMEAQHAWIAVGSQRAAVEGPIKSSNPVRYADLIVPAHDTENPDRAGLAMATWSQATEAQVPAELFEIDPISNAILTQVGAALKTVTSGGPLGEAGVRKLIMGGASQTGIATLNYIRGAQSETRLTDGSRVFDGFLPMAAPGWERVEGGDAAVIQIFAEGDFTLFASIGPQGYMAARPDGDEPADRYRCYQIAGASHLPTRGLADLRALPSLGIALEPTERFTQFPAGPFYQGAFVNLVRWITLGIVPPRADPIAFVGSTIACDNEGNAEGGLRSPYVDVPTARYVPARYVRNLIGVELPFPDDKLRRLYGTPEAYLERFGKAIDALVDGQWILPSDGQSLKVQEAASRAFANAF